MQPPITRRSPAHRRTEDGRRVAPSSFRADYFLVFAICLALTASFFFWLSTDAFACFCTACLFLDFGDLSPMANAKV